MKKLLNKPWFVAVLALGAIAFVGNTVWQGVKGSSGGAASGMAASAAVPEPEATAGEVAARLPVADALQALVIPKAASRDPFAHHAHAEAAAVAEAKPKAPDAVDTLHLSALWTQGGETFTLINDRICQAGDEIGRLKIESATQEGVWITHWKGRDFISLGGDFTLKTPATVSSL